MLDSNHVLHIGTDPVPDKYFPVLGLLDPDPVHANCQLFRLNNPTARSRYRYTLLPNQDPAHVLPDPDPVYALQYYCHLASGPYHMRQILIQSLLQHFQIRIRIQSKASVCYSTANWPGSCASNTVLPRFESSP
jgi:hypothetical protein